MTGKKIKKGEKGAALTYITRSAALKKLQLSIKEFRHLCILKGIYPREPKRSLHKAKKIYYFVKDIHFILHDPLIPVIRARSAAAKKIIALKGRGEREDAKVAEQAMPQLKLDHIIKERYPSFIDAVRDIDDALALMYLFDSYRTFNLFDEKRSSSISRKLREFEAYVVKTNALRKAFVSIKGIYYEAEIFGEKVMWIVPHQFRHTFRSKRVDMLIMVTFLEYYDVLLGFVLFKLYHALGLHYPPNLRPTAQETGVLDQLLRQIESGNTSSSMEIDTVQKPNQQQKKTEKRISTLDATKLISMEEDAKAKEETTADPEVQASTALDEEFEREQERAALGEKVKALFKGLKFFLSREVPRASLELVIQSFGGEVSWEGSNSYKEDDESITHQIVDRNMKGDQVVSRVYIQPQWIYDCVNEKIIIPTAEYVVGHALPPHLSPFVEGDNGDGYIPKRRTQLDRLREALETGAPLEEEAEIEDEDKEDEDKEEDDEAIDTLEDQYATELKAEMSGKTFDMEESNKLAEKVKSNKRKAQEKEIELEKETKAKEEGALMSKKSKRIRSGIAKRVAREKEKGDSLESKRRKIQKEATKSKE